ncbi:DUF6261 family protein [Reichenbachiella versicolor]|uniref:DUF6261 family protein n=1 Tax=Reichenbachiella versicolor TaxID=1821036 RepID=UPI000D6E1568|nr:DUF6261 family protein [Reichenbachiella versicolor]
MNTIHMNHLRNIEFSQFISDCLAILGQHDPEALNIKAEYDALKRSSTLLIQLMMPERGYALTKDMEATDERRDAATNGLLTVITAHQYHYDETIKSHAENLARQFNLYGSGIARQNYQEQTGSLTSLIADIKSKTEMSEAITALKLDDWLAELEDSNIAFSNLYLARNKTMVNQSPETVKETRNKIVMEYYALRDMLGAYNTVNKGAEPFSSAISEVNGIIDSYNQLLEKRQKSNSETEVEG